MMMIVRIYKPKKVMFVEAEVELNIIFLGFVILGFNMSDINFVKIIPRAIVMPLDCIFKTSVYFIHILKI